MEIFKYILYILLGVVILLLMVVIHEFGHYIAGKILKFKIDEFSVGFGPKLLQKKKKNGEVFTLRLVPLGGYCAFTGEDNADGTTIGKKEYSTENTEPSTTEIKACEQESEQDRQTDNVSTEQENNKTDGATVAAERNYLLFDEQKPWKRIIVFIAGPLLNFLSAIVFSFFYILIVGFASPTVNDVFTTADGDVYNPFIKGDRIVAVNDKEINIMNSFTDLTSGIGLGETAVMTVIRDGNEVKLNVTKKEITVTEEGEERTFSGFGFQTRYEYVSGQVGAAFLYAVPITLKFSWMILGTFGQLLTGKIKLTALTGPIGTVSAFADIASQNWLNILIWLPLIASNLAIFNILPIPALDGSKVVFTVIEWIRGKPVNKKVENIIHFAGLVLLFGLVIVIDLIGLFSCG